MKDCEGGIEEVQNGYRGSESPSDKAGPLLRASATPLGSARRAVSIISIKICVISTHKSLDLLTLDRVRLVTMEPGTEKGQVVVRVRKGCLEQLHRF